MRTTSNQNSKGHGNGTPRRLKTISSSLTTPNRRMLLVEAFAFTDDTGEHCVARRTE